MTINEEAEQLFADLSEEQRRHLDVYKQIFINLCNSLEKTSDD